MSLRSAALIAMIFAQLAIQPLAYARAKAAAKAPARIATQTKNKDDERLEARTAGQKKTRIVYRTHTQIDFNGETVQGKIRAPEVFYIFQRKRSEAGHIVKTPARLAHHQAATLDALMGALPK